MTDAGRRFWESLTPRQRAVLTIICESPERIEYLAVEAGLTKNTMKRYLSQIGEKAGMSGRLELMFFCWSNGVVPLPSGPSHE